MKRNVVMTREDIGKKAGKSWTDFIENPPKEKTWLHGIRMTSGTTGSGPMMFCTTFPTHRYSLFARAHNLLICLGMRSLKLSYVRLARRCQSNIPIRVMSLDISDLPRASMLVSDIGVDELFGDNTFVASVLDIISKPLRATLKRVALSGERLTPLLQVRLSNSFPTTTLDMYYTAAEVGPIGFTCSYLKPNTYHVYPDVEISIEDADGTGSGEILVTKQGGPLPVERYRIGDAGRLMHEHCQCGRGFTLEHLGRSGYDYAKFAGAVVRIEEFDRVFLEYTDLFDDYRLEISQGDESVQKKDKITLWAFREKGVPRINVDALATLFSKKVFLTPTRTLFELTEKGLCAPLLIQYTEQPFPKKNKQYKLIDRRI